MAGTEHQWLTMGKARAYVSEHHEYDVTRQTLYNWAKTGRKDIVLQTENWLGLQVTRKDWVDTFVSKTY